MIFILMAAHLVMQDGGTRRESICTYSRVTQIALHSITVESELTTCYIRLNTWLRNGLWSYSGSPDRVDEGVTR